MITVTSAPPLPESPFRGIEPLRFVDQMIFTAREGEIWNLESSITIHRGVLLYGDSGTGKSSLVNAGLIPRLLEEDYVPDRLRVQPRLGKEIKIERISTSVDGKAPYLDSTFAKDATTPSFEVSIEEFIEQLQSLKKPAGAERGTGIPVEVRRPILIFDQFEEFITLFEEAMRDGQTKEAREAAQAQEKILNALVGLMQDNALPVKVLLVFREDYLAKLDLLFEHCPNLLDQYLRLRSPHVEELKQIIRAPFEKQELREQFLKSQGGVGGSEITEELAGRIAAELGKRSEGGRANLSELQIVCRKLWESNDPDKLFEEKGVQGLLEQYLTASVKKFPEDLRDPAVALLGHMITASGTRNIVSKDDLLEEETDNFSQERIERALAALTDSKLVTLEVRRNVYFYEIVSEFLIPWIKEQENARRAFIERRQLAEEAEKKAEQDRLATELKLAKQQKRNIMVASIAAILILVTLVAGTGFFFRQRRIAKDNLAKVEAERLKAEQEVENSKLESAKANLIADKMIRVTSGSPEEKLKALERLNTLVSEGQLPAPIGSAILVIALLDEDRKVESKALEIAQEADRANGQLAEGLRIAAAGNTKLAQKLKSGLTARFYIKLANPEQGERAAKIRKALEEKGYIVSSNIYIVGDGAPNANTLKYIGPAETGELSPNAILALLRQIDGRKWTNTESLGPDPARSKTFEIWLALEIVKTGTLYVHFKDADGKVIENVEFELIILNPFTNNIVRAKLSSGGTYPLPPGQYDMTVRARGYRDTNEDFSIVEDKSEHLELTMQKR